MTQAIEDQFEAVVLPALAEYRAAEGELSDAVLRHPERLDAARELVMRRARTAAIELHQLADFAAHETNVDVQQLRNDIEQHCVFLRDGAPVADIGLLRDVAEAFKHHKLDRKNARVSASNGMTVHPTGYSSLAFGEGKYGGTEQVIIKANDGKQRALSSILQNATDAWRKHLGRTLPAIGEFGS